MLCGRAFLDLQYHKVVIFLSELDVDNPEQQGICKKLTKYIKLDVLWRYHGFVGVSPSLELNGAKGISGAELCVFADRPLLRQAVILSQTLCLIILTGWDAWGQSHMLTYQTPTTAPGGEESVDMNVRLVYKTVR